METISSEEGLVCQTCGAEGFTNAFVYCVKCLGFVIHRYCLDVVPETPDEFVKWFCDDCEPPLPYDFTSPPKHNPSHDPPNSALVKITPPKSKQKKNLLKKRKVASLEDSTFDSGPTKRIDRCVVLGLKKPEPKSLQFQEKVATNLQHVKTHNKCVETPSNSLPNKVLVTSDSGANQITPQSAELCVETPSNSPPNEAVVTSDSGANQITPQSTELDKCCPLKGIVKKKRDTIRVPAKMMKHRTDKPTEHSSCESSCMDVALKNEDDVANFEEGLKTGPHDEKLVYISSSGEEELIKSEEFNVDASASQSNNSENYIHNQPARPVLDPIWRGSFQITHTDYDLFEGFVGHLSSKACRKVFEEATTLPSMLTLEMNSKAHLWPKSFLDSMPSDENIALYFFPGDPKNERDFEQLVNDMIDDDLAMKTTAKNAELLIFTSKVLPQAYWRFQGNYYLWGVFKSKKNDVPVSNHRDNNSLSAKSENKVKSEKENNSLSAKSENKVKSEKEILKPVKTVESHSPQSPLCNYR